MDWKPKSFRILRGSLTEANHNLRWIVYEIIYELLLLKTSLKESNRYLAMRCRCWWFFS